MEKLQLDAENVANNSLENLLFKRSTNRKFDTGKKLSNEKILELLNYARLAPSSFNEQPWEYIYCLQESDSIAKLRTALNSGNEWAQTAPCLMVAVVKKYFDRNGTKNIFAEHDMGLANMVLALKAVEMGLNPHFIGGFDREKVKNSLTIKSGHEPLVMIAVGYPEEVTFPEKIRKALRATLMM
jgi:nitroreductase